MTGAGVLLLRSNRSKRDISRIAPRMHLVTIEMPVDPALFGRSIDALLEELRDD